MCENGSKDFKSGRCDAESRSTSRAKTGSHDLTNIVNTKVCLFVCYAITPNYSTHHHEILLHAVRDKGQRHTLSSLSSSPFFITAHVNPRCAASGENKSKIMNLLPSQKHIRYKYVCIHIRFPLLCQDIKIV